jgi:hypothetical protein
MARAAIFMSEILKAQAEFLGMDVVTLAKKLGEECGDGDPATALSTIFGPLVIHEDDLFGSDNGLLTPGALSQTLSGLLRGIKPEAVRGGLSREASEAGLRHYCGSLLAPPLRARQDAAD